MFNIINWFKKRREQQFEEFLRIRKEQEQATLNAEIANKVALEAVAKELSDKQDKDLKESDTPWVKLESGTVTVDNAIELKLDYNPAFVSYLKQECNFSGDEHQIVQKWLGALMREMFTEGKNDALDIFNQKDLDGKDQLVN